MDRGLIDKARQAYVVAFLANDKDAMNVPLKMLQQYLKDQKLLGLLKHQRGRAGSRYKHRKKHNISTVAAANPPL